MIVSTTCQERIGNTTHVDERINTAVLDHLPGILGRREVGLSVESNVTEGVSVEEIDGPLQHAENTSKNTEYNIAKDVSLRRPLTSSYRAQVSQELNNGDKQASQANGSKAVCKCALGGATGGVLGEVVGAEVPGTVDASDDGVDGVLEPLGDPVHGKSNKGDQANDLALATAAASARWVVVGRLIFVVNGDEGDGVPRAKCSCDHSTDEANKIRMTVFLADVNSCLQHQC